jgi:CheY-like chemotaxis protein/predicted regulator of Ras-like GTPase activity (Roadblock/LC7/MglB family)
MSKKKILIVDDAWDILFLLAHSVKRLNPDYDVTTAADGPTALGEAKKQKFDLVLTDHMMPKMTGLELARSIRVFSPDTQVVLMTAYQSQQMRTIIDEADLDGYIGKPFKLPELLKMIDDMISGSGQQTESLPADTPTLPEKVSKHLQDLWYESGAEMVLLLNTDREPLQVIGETNQNKISHLAAFVADNFMAVTELASLLGDNTSTFKSSYHEGNQYNIYSLDINGDLLLAIVFDAKRKPGPIWIFARQAAAALALLFPSRTQ